MITLKAKDFYYSGTKDRIEGECLSTDTKPTTYANGSVLIEMDTGDRFMFDEANGEWLNITNPGGGGDAEVWLEGNEYTDRNGMRWFVLSNAGDVDHMIELNTNPEAYQVYLSGEELPYLDTLEEETNKTTAWGNASTPAEQTLNVTIVIGEDEGTVTENAYAIYKDASTAPASVEVSVKAK